MRQSQRRRTLSTQQISSLGHNSSKPKTNRFLCVLFLFVVSVVIVCVLLIYFSNSWYQIEKNRLDHDQAQPNDVNDIQDMNEMNDNIEDNHIMSENNDIILHTTSNYNKNEPNIYNISQSILIRMSFISSFDTNAKPLLVGLGAEKSGSTSLGAAMFSSGVFSCPKSDEIDTETKYWTDCINSWITEPKQMDKLISDINNKKLKCSIDGYLNYGKWRNGNNMFEKSVDYLGLPYISYIFSEIFVRKHGTKIFVMARYPPPRISSTYYFFVGAEKDKMPNEYGNVERFTNHLLENELLIEMISLLDRKNVNKDIMDLDWENDILIKWNAYMKSMQSQCKKEALIAGFKPQYCNPTQLLRRAVGLSCYVVPIMQWFVYLTESFATNSFKIIQSELFFKDGNDIVDRLMCWVKYGTVNVNDCDTSSWSNRLKIKKLTSTNQNYKMHFSDQLIQDLSLLFEPCNARLFELLRLYPMLALKEFAWSEWHYQPEYNIVI